MEDNKKLEKDSVGLVEPKKIAFKEPLTLECGEALEDIEIVYETYGTLNEERDNAVLICHALSGNHHAAGFSKNSDKRPGWWDGLIGPNKAIDTNKLFVVCPNNLGGCHGSTGPKSINPKTGKTYGPDFPLITVLDWVNCQAIFSDLLGIESWQCVIGGSLGGMQALQWCLSYPDRIKRAGVIAAAARLSAQNIAFNEVARQAIISDPEFQNGLYLENNKIPKRGLRLARMVGHITYLSDEAMRDKFGRDLKKGKLNFGFDAEFEVESYLRHQGDVFSETFDANTYLIMTKLLDYFDPASEFQGDLVKTFASIKAKLLVVSFSTDWRFSPARSKEIVNALISAKKNASYIEIKSSHGHDSFLFPEERYTKAINAFLDN
ncbi:MAG: homoserine O-acetyltransferase [Pseudomonadota bacterium]|nr:homoserine O-acetyltransferase [Pseudomonadota bacterium]|tara:strand:+ start:95 stop:1228 length:1134 start_codon:yes stop_codon:yes gene_type:complete